MTISLENLEGGTEFSIGSRKFKKGASSWGMPTAERLRSNQSFFSEDSVNHACHECYPYFGGQYQTNITIWVPTNTQIPVTF